MKVVSKSISKKGVAYYTKYIEIINILLPEDKFEEKLSSKEIEVLAVFLSLPIELTEEDMFNGTARKKAMKLLGNMKPGGLGNHLRSLIDKKFLQKNSLTNRIKMSSFLIPDRKSQGFRLKLVNN